MESKAPTFETLKAANVWAPFTWILTSPPGGEEHAPCDRGHIPWLWDMEVSKSKGKEGALGEQWTPINVPNARCLLLRASGRIEDCKEAPLTKQSVTHNNNLHYTYELHRNTF